MKQSGCREKERIYRIYRIVVCGWGIWEWNKNNILFRMQFVYKAAKVVQDLSVIPLSIRKCFVRQNKQKRMKTNETQRWRPRCTEWCLRGAIKRDSHFLNKITYTHTHVCIIHSHTQKKIMRKRKRVVLKHEGNDVACIGERIIIYQNSIFFATSIHYLHLSRLILALALAGLEVSHLFQYLLPQIIWSPSSSLFSCDFQ